MMRPVIRVVVLLFLVGILGTVAISATTIAGSHTLHSNELWGLVGGQTYPYYCCTVKDLCEVNASSCDEQTPSNCYADKLRIEYGGNKEACLNPTGNPNHSCTQAITEKECAEVWNCMWDYVDDECDVASGSTVSMVAETCSDSCPP